MSEPTGGSALGRFLASEPSPSDPVGGAINASYSHTCAAPCSDLPAGSGQVMTSTTIYYVFWLPTGQHFGSSAGDDTAYENLLVQWANDLGASQYHNLVTQYSGTNGTITGTVNYGGSWTDTNAYPHAGTKADPIQDSDVQQAVKDAVAANGWTEDVNHIVAVFTANGILECASFGCMSDPGGFCAYHDHFSDSGNDTVYAFMGYDDFQHVANYTCDAGDTNGDNDPNRGNYPNGNKSADVEINTLSHEVTEAETDPHPNDTWTAPKPEGEIGDACNFNFAPRNDSGADVYMNGHGYIMQQEFSNAAHTCAIDLPTNGFCSGSVSNVCSPTTSFSKSVDNANPRVHGTIHYTLTLNNTNDTGAETNLQLTDTLPAGYTVTTLSAPSATSQSSTSTSVTVNYDTLPVHQSRTVTITATVPVQAGTPATNCGSLSGQDLIGTSLGSAQTTSPCATTTPVKIPTVVTYTGPTSGDYNDSVTVSARLTDDSSNPLSGKRVYFTLNGVETCNDLTDVSGNVSCPITPGETSGPYTLNVAFTDSSDPEYATSSTNPTFNVTREETTTAYTGPIVLLGSSATLQGTLLEDGTTGIAGRTLTLGVGGVTCTTLPTNSSGVASCNVSTSSLGSQALTASFAGDGYYLPSSDTSGKTAIVFAFPSRGAFAIGNLTSGPSVTWWSDIWNQQNTLSGGGAPSAFKGFVGNVTLPNTSPANICSGNWTSFGGNSPPPPATVPSYMGVIVANTATKAPGNTVSGHYLKIVVVKTDPGYAPGPSNTGTGTIVATFCP